MGERSERPTAPCNDYGEVSAPITEAIIDVDCRHTFRRGTPPEVWGVAGSFDERRSTRRFEPSNSIGLMKSISSNAKRLLVPASGFTASRDS